MIPNQHFLLTLAHTLIDLNADVLAPSICKVNTKESNQLENCAQSEIGAVVRSPGMLNEVTILPNVTRLYEDDTHALHPILLSSRPKHGSIGERQDCHRSDLIFQSFFIANVEKLIKSGWDDQLKANVFYDAILSMQKNEMRLFTCHRLKIGHTGQHAQSTSNVRSDKWMDFMPYVLQKWNLKALNDEAGRKWSLNSRDTIQWCQVYPPTKVAFCG